MSTQQLITSEDKLVNYSQHVIKIISASNNKSITFFKKDSYYRYE